MDINFACESCGQNIVIDAAGAGLSTECPKCGQSLTVPSQPQRQAEPSATTPPATESASPSETKQCPYCAETIKREAKVCRFCGRDILAEKSTASPKNGKPLLWSLAIVILVVGVLGIGLWYRQKAEQTKLANQQAERAKEARQKAEQEEKDRQRAQWERKSRQWDSVMDKIEARLDEINKVDLSPFIHCRTDREFSDEEIRLEGFAASKQTEILDITADLSVVDFPGAGDLKGQVSDFFSKHELMIIEWQDYEIRRLMGLEYAESEKRAREALDACHKAARAIISLRSKGPERPKPVSP